MDLNTEIISSKLLWLYKDELRAKSSYKHQVKPADYK